MRKLVLGLGAAATLLTLSMSQASAHDWSWYRHVDQTRTDQQRRILDGVAQGDLTPAEFRKLEAEQARIKALEIDARRDRAGPVAYARIRTLQAQASHDIYAERHDGERWGWWNRWWR